MTHPSEAIAKRLKAAVESGRFGDLAELYPPDARLVASLGREVEVEGRARVSDQDHSEAHDQQGDGATGQ